MTNDQGPMTNSIHNLDRESLLVLYWGDELSVDDRRRVDEMLAVDPALRAELDQLNIAQQAMSASFAEADAKRPLPAPLSSSLRHVSGAMAQWQVDRLAKPTIAPQRAARRFGWMYGVGAAAAAIIITVFVLWSRVDDGKNDQLADLMNKIQSNDPLKAPDNNPADDVADYTPTGGESDVQLTRAEGELYALSALTDSLRPTEETVTP